MQSIQYATDVLLSIPSNLPIPLDDGACEHLEKMPMPDVYLVSTEGENINFSRLRGWHVVFCYPMTGCPGVAIPEGWAQIPGAAGCTSQVCSFSQNFGELKRKGVGVYGISAQVSEMQKEASTRLGLSYPLLSDFEYSFSTALKLPLFEVGELKLIKRLTLIAQDGVIKKCFYPVFPPDKNIAEVFAWFAEDQSKSVNI
jgi:peroxiredoxin